MKKNLILAAVATAATLLWGADAEDEQMSVVIGSSAELVTTFPIQEARCESPNVKLSRTGNKSYRVQGVLAGSATVELVGTDTLKTYVVTVVDSLQPIIKALSRDLEEVPEVEMSVNYGKICLRGVIAKPEHWDLYHLVLSRYKEYCFDYVVFVPGQELLKKLSRLLAQSGYRTVDEATSDNPGCVEMKYAGGVLTMTGYFFNKNDVAEVEKIVGRQTWISTKGAITADKRTGNVPCILNFYVVDRLIDVGVVFVTISRNALENIGLETDASLGALSLVGQLNKVFSLRDGTSNSQTFTAKYEGGIEGELQFLAEHKVVTSRTSGHVTFNSNGEKAAKATFNNGGEVTMKVTGINGGDVKTLTYGLTIGVEGILTHADEVKLDLDLVNSAMPEKIGEDYTQTKVSSRMPVVACLGETVIVGGSHIQSHSDKGPSGYAVLRWIPIVSWFVSNASESVDDAYTLVLITPEYADESEPLRKRPSEETARAERQVSKDMNTAVKERIKETGAWYKVFFFWRWFENEGL